MKLALKPASDHGLAATAEILNQGFTDYWVPIHLDRNALLNGARMDGMDIASSRVVVRSGKPVGAALIARRGWTSRLAGMALVPAARRQGIGRWVMNQLISEAANRGERAMVLEVITENTPAVRLYESCGFRRLRRLVSFTLPPHEREPIPAPDKVDVYTVSRLVTAHSLADLPWQVSGESLAQIGPPNRAFHLDGAWSAVTDPSQDQVVIRSIVTEPESRRRGRAATLLKSMIDAYPGAAWRVPPICPEEIGGLFEKVGFVQEGLSQFQMRVEW